MKNNEINRVRTSAVTFKSINYYLNTQKCGNVFQFPYLLADRKDRQGFQSEILLNDQLQRKDFQYYDGYVVQDDIVSGTKKNKIVDEIIIQLRLEKYANTTVGADFKHRVSGRQRKRTNIEMELVLSPMVLFLDEPTTGLDSSMVRKAIECLHRLFRTGSLIPSVGCSIAILYHMLSNQTRRHAINNHVIILLLFNNLMYELIDIPLFLNYYRLDTVLPATQSLCLMWIFIDEALYSVSTITVAWASIERHILIFHSQWLSSSRRRFLIHYVPLVSLVSYDILFHFVVIVFPPCENSFCCTIIIFYLNEV
ncbi:unnamed protein product [Rotaria sp. Silwood1]|nr:unnamed protein product [Rotaria sp. Silwood1]